MSETDETDGRGEGDRKDGRMMGEVKKLSGWVAWPLLLSFAMIVISAFCMLLFGIWMMWGGVNGETAFAWKLALSIGAVSAFVFFVSAFIGRVITY